ncbi:hypothetical protein [Cellulomonas cellasea]|uniref:Uncharacterized protein n=1 Tax=Cellulomonas cellasea TaxID=43670 RepID=A0A7W4YCZ2_9CELL|nr:hypothetical protein [Cellulomonas cellasea]MBB2924654.1 hypothetical protein [Cellulomonas cellasea]
MKDEEEGRRFDAPTVAGDETAALPFRAPPPLPEGASDDQETVERNRARLMAIDGVIGVGMGARADGSRALVVYVRNARTAGVLPERVDGIPVDAVEVPGGFHAL